ncbi:DNA-protecting protein DprA [Herbaspirillum sp. meg3]|uniref:DNA-processing protein DprA n=1 Tax=Herbaspirillum sp. meg3 TaxID=2025949 RepID=UPI000B991E3C|nr:DNA-processing protein DprA [Herbaspirillum sp. meg3]ASU36940.1 DNA-protecting protein DprA [Herbaspirillum sp. meg3]
MLNNASLNDTTELSDWLRLTQTEGVGVEVARRLLTAFGMPSDIFAADVTALSAVVTGRIARALLKAPSAMIQNHIERTLDWVDEPGNRIVTLADADYPQALLNISDPPVLLYIKGRAELLAATSLAVVGSRNATTQGIQNSEHFSDAASRAGLTIVSGLALGIDAAAHQGGLRGFGSTVAVIGTGLDIVYPARNRTLAHRLAEEGCIVSEYPLGMPPIASNFPRRNRIISGLSRAVLVVEAAAQSGSLITARMAAEQGRDVFAIPGSIHSPLSKGCHLLIKQGAKLVESAEDILEELGKLPLSSPSRLSLPSLLPPSSLHAASSTSTSSTPTNNREDDVVLRAMGFDPIAGDMLSMRSGFDAAALNAHLLTLEMEGVVECLPGGLYRRIN